MRRRTLLNRAAAAAATAAVCGLSLAGCGSDDAGEAPPQTRSSARTSVGELGIVGSWVGKVAGGDTFVGISVFENRDLMAYVCDGKQISQWFLADSQGRDSFEATSKAGAKLTATLTIETATGVFTLPDGTKFDFEAARAALDGGLYRAKENINGKDYVGGWIVLPSGEQRGAITGGSQLVNGGLIDTANPVATIVGVGALQARLVNPYTLRDIDF